MSQRRVSRAAPYRCFIIDLPGLLLLLSSSSSATTTTSNNNNNNNNITNDGRSPPKRILSPSPPPPLLLPPRCVRLLGTVISITKILTTENTIPSNDCNRDNNNNNNDNYWSIQEEEEPFVMLVVDDGTGAINCRVGVAMIERLFSKQQSSLVLSLLVGRTIDCIGTLQQVMQRTSGNNDTTTTTAAVGGAAAHVVMELELFVDTLLEVRHNPTTAERLRWMEIIALQQQQQQTEQQQQLPRDDDRSYDSNQSTNTTSNARHAEIAWCGYPCPEMTSADLLEVIESVQQLDPNNNNNNTNDDNHQDDDDDDQNDQNDGATLQNLALVLDLDLPTVKALT